MFHRKDQIVFSRDSPSSVLGGHSKPLTFACLPGKKKIYNSLDLPKILYYCPVKEHKEYQIPLFYRGSFKNPVLGALQKPSSVSRTFISNCLQGLSALSLRREICDCPTALNTPEKPFTVQCKVICRSAQAVPTLHITLNTVTCYRPQMQHQKWKGIRSFPSLQQL